jgi:hypothetical protein
MSKKIRNLPKNPDRIYTIRDANRERYYIVLTKSKTFSIDSRFGETFTVEDFPKDFDYEENPQHWNWEYEIFSEHPDIYYSRIGKGDLHGQYDQPPRAEECFMDFLQRLQWVLVSFASHEHVVTKENCHLYNSK